MAGLIISEAVQYGIKGTKKTRKTNSSKRYKSLVAEANEMIRQDNQRYARAYAKAMMYRAL